MSIEKFTENLIYSQYFSFEVLYYFDSISTKDNINWIIKYFNLLIKTENQNSTKYHNHHIIPCLIFKDENHKNRKYTLPLADNIKENLIKLSICNHIKAHYYLWKILNTWTSKHAVQQLCQMENIENFTDKEINEICIIKEECAKKNKTEKEKKEYHKNYYSNNRDNILKNATKWVKEHIDQVKKNKSNWYQRSREDILKERKDNRPKYLEKERNYRHAHKERYKELNTRPCYDPIRKEYCTWNALKKRRHRNKNLYKDVILTECLIKDLMIIPQPNA